MTSHPPLVLWHTMACGWTENGTQLTVGLTKLVTPRVTYEVTDDLTERITSLLGSKPARVDFDLRDADDRLSSTFTVVADGLLLSDPAEFRKVVEESLSRAFEYTQKDGARVSEQYDAWRARLLAADSGPVPPNS